jgi:hypothetical protein
MLKIFILSLVLCSCKPKEVRESKSILERSYLLDSVPANLTIADFQVLLDGKPSSQFSVFRSLNNDRYVIVLQDQNFLEMVLSAKDQQFVFNFANPVGWKAIPSYEFRTTNQSPCAKFVHPESYFDGFLPVVGLIWSSKAYASSYSSYCDVSFKNFWQFTGN